MSFCWSACESVSDAGAGPSYFSATVVSLKGLEEFFKQQHRDYLFATVTLSLSPVICRELLEDYHEWWISLMQFWPVNWMVHEHCSRSSLAALAFIAFVLFWSTNMFFCWLADFGKRSKTVAVCSLHTAHQIFLIMSHTNVFNKRWIRCHWIHIYKSALQSHLRHVLCWHLHLMPLLS